ncbi:MAG: NADH-quinone oxidoreductase subunit N [Cyclobacteriaceae bacterium]|jgi:NADH-quinone oxidoreductase subunit N
MTRLQLQSIIDQLLLLRPEIILIAGAVALLLLVPFRNNEWLLKSLVTIVIIVAFLLAKPFEGLFFEKMLIFDSIAFSIKRLLMLVTVLIVWFDTKAHHHLEYYFFLLAGLVGAMLMTTTSHFLLIYLAIELASFASYFLTGLRFQIKSGEATIKYVLFGGVTSSIMLFGISLIYGAQGSLLLLDLSNQPLSNVGLVLFAGGMLFKAGLVPFHLWTPNVYQEAPSDAVAFFSVVPKLGAFVLIYHVMSFLPISLYSVGQDIGIVIALITVLWGTLSAIPQDKVKRMMAYGAIAHSGFLLPMTLFGEVGLTAFSYYSVIYAIMNVGIFYILHLHESDELSTLKFTDLDGFGTKYPWVAAGAVVLLIGLVGLPPTAGFTAKLFLFSLIADQYQTGSDPLLMAFLVVGILSSLLSLYYYFKIPISYFFRTSENAHVQLSSAQQFAATILAMILLWVFIQPEILNRFVF